MQDGKFWNRENYERSFSKPHADLLSWCWNLDTTGGEASSKISTLDPALTKLLRKCLWRQSQYESTSVGIPFIKIKLSPDCCTIILEILCLERWSLYWNGTLVFPKPHGWRIRQPFSYSFSMLDTPCHYPPQFKYNTALSIINMLVKKGAPGHKKAKQNNQNFLENNSPLMELEPMTSW